MNNPTAEFAFETEQRIRENEARQELQSAARSFNVESNKAKYSYNFKWMGRPIIQYPQDILAMQELIWDIKPDLIIETGIAHGGSLIFYASMLELIGKGEVVGVDIDIREHNRKEIEKHPMFKRITMIQGSSIDPIVIDRVKEIAKDKQTILVVLDSNHTHSHVLKEMEAYGMLVSVNSYMVVFDTIVEQLPPNYLPDHKRPWGIGDNPFTAVKAFLKENTNFQVDQAINNKLLISVAPDGYLKRIN
jgi:cephalosporin hydroxylase